MGFSAQYDGLAGLILRLIINKLVEYSCVPGIVISEVFCQVHCSIRMLKLNLYIVSSISRCEFTLLLLG